MISDITVGPGFEEFICTLYRNAVLTCQYQNVERTERGAERTKQIPYAYTYLESAHDLFELAQLPAKERWRVAEGAQTAATHRRLASGWA